jgi:hypothetical protein
VSARGPMPKNKNKNKYPRGVRVLSAKAASKMHLVKIGQIAIQYRILPSTINFYTREGLLPEDARSLGGYRLYHRQRTLSRLKKIDYLQNKKRLTIAEIKKYI